MGSSGGITMTREIIIKILADRVKAGGITLEQVPQAWRDIPQTTAFPNVTHPAPLPVWFPKVRFFSRWEKDVYIEKTLERQQKEL